jgi:hypothetical protein
MTTGRELIPLPALPARRRQPPQGDLRRLLRDLRTLCGVETPACDTALRAYRAGSLVGSGTLHRVDLRL